MFCTECGNSLLDNSIFCSKCGKKISSSNELKNNNNSSSKALIEKSRLKNRNPNYSDSSNRIIYKHPGTGHTVSVNKLSVYLGTFLVAPIFFLIIGEYLHAVITLIGNLLLGAFVPIWFIYALCYTYIAPEIIDKKWVSRGYIRQ